MVGPPCDFGREQRKDEDVKELMEFVEAGDLPVDSKNSGQKDS